MFDLYAQPVGQHEVDRGPIGYLSSLDNPGWSFGLRFPGKPREWFKAERWALRGSETLLIERDGALVLMNSLRIPKLTASIDEALRLVPDRHRWLLDKRPGAADRHDGYRAQVYREAHPYASDGSDTPTHWGASPALALCVAALRARLAETGAP
jgi:hypothetical protein